MISLEQFCSIDGRSIVNCNTLLRDVLFYANSEEKQAAMANLDWRKAFHQVPIDFVLKILNKFGFDGKFIRWIKMLYMNASSTLCINGILGNPFNTGRSDRQGCPLSMILYVIFQEQLYKMIKASSTRPFKMPNNLSLKIIGHADDSTVFICNIEDLVKLDNIIKKFEYATGALLNRNKKTAIMGLGAWANKSDWPVTWINSVNCTKVLGVHYCINYDDTHNKN